MGLNTDDGFFIESRLPDDAAGATDGKPRVFRWIALAASAEEAVSLLDRDFPGAENAVVDSGREIRAQAARLGLVPGTYQRA